jgi:uncharacterized Tic20 family protein
VLPYFVFLLSLLVVIVLLQVYRTNKKMSEKLGVEAYGAFDYKITLFIKIALYILMFFSVLTFVSAIGELIAIGTIDEFIYLIVIAFFGFGFSLICLFRESRRTPRFSN